MIFMISNEKHASICFVPLLFPTAIKTAPDNYGWSDTTCGIQLTRCLQVISCHDGLWILYHLSRKATKQEVTGIGRVDWVYQSKWTEVRIPDPFVTLTVDSNLLFLGSIPHLKYWELMGFYLLKVPNLYPPVAPVVVGGSDSEASCD